ncbi:MAG TPA: hypothetical protein VKQ05_11530 [Gemmatimonadales bacterium]|nr:hypothetical protein [Gemmatimonadales bacterium]
MRLRLAVMLVLAAAPGLLAAQSGPSRLQGRVAPAALPTIDSIIAVAVAESLPTEPLVQKALEGSAKKIPPDRLVSGVLHGLAQLREAHALISQAVPGQPVPEGHVVSVAAALARGLPPPIVQRLVAMAPAEPPGPVLHAAADLVAHHFDPDSAAGLLIDAHTKGLRGVRLLDVATAADHELQRRGGRTHAEVLAHVRDMLPNVPGPKATVARP